MFKSELLIPVGNFEVLKYAVNYGADAVYFAGKKFGARAYAGNFSCDEIIEAINYCHLRNVLVYITMNTIVYNNEINEFLEFIKYLYKNNVDAVIMQDIGMITLVRELFPDLEIHASTQMNNYSKESFELLQKLGVKRVVLARELSLNEITKIDTKLEKEVFIHGALCVCYSGCCLMSSLNGARSGNRGCCTQNCRLKYTLYNDKKIDEGFLLSTKELNSTENIKELLDNNITSLKIEGRNKSKYYVGYITSIYRKLIDNYYNNKYLKISDEEKTNIETMFNRLFTKGYLFNEESIINKESSNHRGSFLGKVIKYTKKYIYIKLDHDLNQFDGIRFINSNEGMNINNLYDEKELLKNKISKNQVALVDNKIDLKYLDDVYLTSDYLLQKELDNYNLKKVPININISIKRGEKCFIEINGLNKKVFYQNFIPEVSLTKPLEFDTLYNQFSKLGDTPFYLDGFNAFIDDNLFLPLGIINELRREAIDLLIKSICEKKSVEVNNKVLNDINVKEKELIVKINSEKQLLKIKKYNITTYITSDFELYSKYKNEINIFLEIPCVNELINYVNEKLLVADHASFYKYYKNNEIYIDYKANVVNDYSIDFYNQYNVKGITLSVENNIDSLKNITLKNNAIIYLYGKPEVMIIKDNIFNVDKGNYNLKCENREYEVKYINNTHIFNYQNINLLNQYQFLNYNRFRIDLNNETDEELINIFKNIL